ncbi:MAG: metal-dependent transcriptional regulator [Atopobiaceae bacterium]|jgi:Mn-dependent DtxR family transcriptional regulator|nr:metal-dependent transcriptional regulator [Atopobiaceae bacterium]NLH91624.1 metal-dependent transcriptional regulator [Atopobium sp.]
MTTKISTHGKESLTMASEDYLEAIFRLSTEKGGTGEVHSVDVADQLHVSKASVNKALAVLRENGMIEQMRYGCITLTDRGKAYGADVWHRHRTLRAFLTQTLGVDAKTANDEACLMEHDLSEDTMRRWVDYLESQGVSLPD